MRGVEAIRNIDGQRDSTRLFDAQPKESSPMARSIPLVLLSSSRR